MSESPPFYSGGSESLASTPPASRRTCEPGGTSRQQMAESQVKESCLLRPESSASILRTASGSRRHSAEGVIISGSGSDPSHTNCFHTYHTQFGEEDVMTSLFQEPLKPSYFLSQSFPSCNPSSGPLQQVSSRKYSRSKACSSFTYSLATQSQQGGSTPSLFPKPIYSYSILIFMALKNSRTGSLPVNEIYSFMTEHFPYFKTAPDGWKNSVRHNLSLNKCFVKVENKNGSSSRKGCLWSLNPAKVEKMQDELHKWRRKDPVTVRRSMARPECMDRLLGEKPERLRSLLPYSHTALFSRVAPIYSTPAQLQPPFFSSNHPHYAHIQPQPPYCLPSASAAHPSNSFALYSPCGPPAATGCLNSAIAGKMPPVHKASLQEEYGLGCRSMQELLLLEGDVSCDIDTLNPSLTDLQLQGNIWEELREDSLVSDSHFNLRTPLTIQDRHFQTTCLQESPPHPPHPSPPPPPIGR